MRTVCAEASPGEPETAIEVDGAVPETVHGGRLGRMTARVTARVSPSARRTLVCMIVIVAGVLLANMLFLTKVRDPNPLLTRSGLVATEEPGWAPGHQTIDPNDGFTAQALGHAAASQWLNGSVPYWNHYEGVGSPLAGEMQSAALFPLVLLLHFADGLLYMHVLLQILAGIATYLFLRRLHLSRWAATGAGLAFACNGTFAWLTNAVFNPIAFLPLLMLGIEMAFDESGLTRRRGAVVIALALAGSLSSGFPETAYLSALFAYSWGALRLWQHRRTWSNHLPILALGSFAGLFLAAPVLAAFTGYLPYANVGIHTGNYGTLPSFGLHSFVLPYLYGPIFGFLDFATDDRLLVWWSNIGGYLAGTILVLAVAALFSRRARALKVFLVVWIVLAMSRIYGFGRLGEVLGYVPAVPMIAFYRYGTLIVEFAALILAAMAFDHIVERSASRRVVALVAAFCGGLVVFSALSAGPDLASIVAAPHHRIWIAASVGWALLSILVVGVACWLPGRRQRGLVLFGVVAIDALVLFMVPQISTTGNRMQQLDTAPVQYLQAHAGLASTYSMAALQPNYGSYFGVRLININDLPIPQSYHDYISNHLDANVDPVVFTGANRTDPNGPTTKDEFFTNLLSYEEVGVKFVMVPNGMISDSESSNHRLTLVFTGATQSIFELPDPKPYFQVEAGDCETHPDSYDQVRMSCQGEATLVRREQFMPGWSAEADGTPLAITRTGEIFQSVTVPAGQSTVVFRYQPPHTRAAWALWFLAALCLIGITPAVSERLARLRHRPADRSADDAVAPITS
jgi:hypothetical protein